MTSYLVRMLSTAAMSCVMALHPSVAGAQTDGGEQWATPKVSVTNLRQQGDYDAGMETQALLGMPMKVVGKESWLRVVTPDRDTAWVLPSTVQVMSAAEMHRWNTAPQVVVTSVFGYVYTKPSVKSEIVSDVVASCRLRLLSRKGKFYCVEYPDGRRGYLPTADAKPIGEWRKALRRDAQSIIATGRKLMGAPYMWGGTSTKGVDCSGFVRTTLLQHDMVIPRNASQQAVKGQHIDIAPDFSNLVPGDLVFFGRKATADKKAHVSHVGIYIGGKRFMHSLGNVRVNSFDPAEPDYDEYDHNRLLWAQRVLPFINMEDGMCTTDRNEYYR